jgi:hypothetical protein
MGKSQNKRVMTEELRLQMDELQREVMKGVEQIRNGQSISVESDKLDEFFDKIITEGKAKFEANRKLNS